MHPMSLANLAIGRARLVEKRKNGELSNPEGSSLTSALKRGLNKPFQVPDVDAPVRDHIVYKTLKGAYDLVPVAFKETWDRAEGKVPGDVPPASQDNRVTNFVFILPDGTKVSPEALRLVKDAGKLVEGEDATKQEEGQSEEEVS